MFTVKKTITAIIGSPHNSASFTRGLVADFLDLVLARCPGVEANVLSLGMSRVEPCTGCFRCFGTGICDVLDDDLREVQAQVLAADLVILASPVHANHVSAQMKSFVDRSFAWSHALTLMGKPVMTAVTAAYSDMTATEDYLDWVACALGAIPVGHLRRVQNNPFVDIANRHDAEVLADRAAALLGERQKPQPTDANRAYFESLKELLAYLPAEYARSRWVSHGWFAKTYDEAMSEA